MRNFGPRCLLDFALPLLRAAAGEHDPFARTQTLRTCVDLPAVGPRREFLRAVETDGQVCLAGSQDSSALSALAAADALIDRPAHSTALPGGSPVRAFLLRNG